MLPVHVRQAWSDRFATPDADALVAGLKSGAGELFLAAQEHLHELGVGAHTIAWLGVPWRWAFVYAAPGDPDEVLAFLVPQPDRPQLCVPLTDEMLDALAHKRLSKAMRDGITFAAHVGGVRWASWPLMSQTQIGEAMVIIQTRFASCAAS